MATNFNALGTTLALGLALLDLTHPAACSPPMSLGFEVPGPSGEFLPLVVEPMEILAADSTVVRVVGGCERSSLLEPGRIALAKLTSLDGLWSGFLARGPKGALGWLESDGRRLTLMSAGSREFTRGLRPGPWRWVDEGPASAAPTDELCRMLELPGSDGGVAGSTVPGINAGVLPRIVEMAADADYEFTSMFPDAQACIDYVIALYGANSYILGRDCSTNLKLNYLRLFETPDDLYNEADPLGPFRDEWTANQTEVARDLAQLLTGRRNLPYGGVAWLNAACQNYGYSVSGYMIGSFADATATNPGNWDVIVSTHEIGHNIGTLHTHDYGIDTCASGGVQRGTIMSYCHVVSGATANIDLRFHRGTAYEIELWGSTGQTCMASDCNRNGQDDAAEIASGSASDGNSDGIPDACQDCDSDGILDPVEILLGSPDLDQNQRPDSCDIDCDSNGVPDMAQIAANDLLDGDGNFVLDSCQSDCDGNGVADGVDLIVDVARDIDRDGRIDSCEDCDANSVADLTQLAGALGLWTIQSSPPLLVELDGRSGVRRRSLDLAQFGITRANSLDVSPQGNVLISATIPAGNGLFEFQPIAGGTRWVVAAGASPAFPSAARMRTNAGVPSTCDVLDPAGHRITRWRTSDGAALGTVVTCPTTVDLRAFTSDATRCLVLRTDGSILQSSPIGAAPTLWAQLAVPCDPSDIAISPDGRVLVSDRLSDSVIAFSAAGANLGRFDVGPVPTSSVALIDPQEMRIARQNPDVVFIVASGANAAVHGFRISDGYYLRTYRIYRSDAIGSDGIAQMLPSSIDADMNFEIDSCEATARADLNADGTVDGLDLTQMLAAWGTSGNPADINQDGTVNGIDLTALLAAWTH